MAKVKAEATGIVMVSGIRLTVADLQRFVALAVDHGVDWNAAVALDDGGYGSEPRITVSAPAQMKVCP